jgi:Mlc titration factor MtfA (ptsG expression regulator)
MPRRTRGQDVVLHEFAHQLDSETGSTNGAPALLSAAAYQAWSQVMVAEFAQLQQAMGRITMVISHHQQPYPDVIDPYGATNPAEFCCHHRSIFQEECGAGLHHPALFAQLKSYYCVDPREWV